MNSRERLINHYEQLLVSGEYKNHPEGALDSLVSELMKLKRESDETERRFKGL